MGDLRAIIVHISDLHFGRNFNTELRAHLERLIIEQRVSTPNGSSVHLVVSGDICENPFPWLMKKAASYLNGLSCHCNNTIVIPGNHDYRIKGIFGLRRLSRIPFEIYFRRNGNDMGPEERKGAYSELFFNAIRPSGELLRDKLEIKVDDTNRIVFFGFNSTPLFEGFATGKVSANQVLELVKTVKENRQHWEHYLKIAIVHHHPLPIPYDLTGAVSRVEESLMVFYGAGAFLRELARYGIDLVLHGHKHLSGFSRVTYDYPDIGQRTIGVLAAGSATHKRANKLGGNSINVIKVHDDDTVVIEHWHYSPGVFRKDNDTTYDLYNFEDTRRYRRLRRQPANISIEQVRKVVRLTYNGYSDIEVRFQNCRVISQAPIRSIQLDEINARPPAYIRGAKAISDPTVLKGLTLKCNKHLRKIAGELHLGRPINNQDSSVNAGLTYRLMNGHSLSFGEFRRKYAGKSYGKQPLEWEFSSIDYSKTVEMLSLTVEFPEKFDLANIAKFDAVAVFIPKVGRLQAEDKQEHDAETRRIKDRVILEGKSLSLRVPSPIPDFIYQVRWAYKDKPDKRSGKLTPIQERSLEQVRADLIQTARTSAEQGASLPAHEAILKGLNEFLLIVNKRYPQVVANEQLNISFAVFDDEYSTLRFVAANFLRISDIIEETFSPGEGCIGFAYEKKRVVFYNRKHDPLGYYISPEERSKEAGKSSSPLIQDEVLLAIPWVDETGVVMGVINVGSSQKNSRLLRVFELNETEESSILINLTNSFLKSTIRYTS
jgi:3',5'-cyclic AMP phosphodiesterase CpdA